MEPTGYNSGRARGTSQYHHQTSRSRSPHHRAQTINSNNFQQQGFNNNSNPTRNNDYSNRSQYGNNRNPNGTPQPFRPSKPSTEVNDQLDEDELWPEIIDIPTNQWLFSKEDLQNKTASRLSTFAKYDAEICYRGKSCYNISKLAKELKLHPRTVAAACTYIQRFYMFENYGDSEYKDVLVTAVFLATKAEENMKSIKVVVEQAIKLFYARLPEDDRKELIWKLTDNIKLLENKMLIVLKFNLSIVFPKDAFKSKNTEIIGGTTPNVFNLEVEWFFDNLIFIPACVLFNSDELAACGFFSVCTHLSIKVPHLHIQKIFGVGLKKLREILEFLKECFEILGRNSIVFKLREGPTVLEKITEILNKFDNVTNEMSEKDWETGKNETVIKREVVSSIPTFEKVVEPKIESKEKQVVEKQANPTKIKYEKEKEKEKEKGYDRYRPPSNRKPIEDEIDY